MFNVVLTYAITSIYLTIAASSLYYHCPVKRKQALLGSNLPGITGSKMSWTKRSVAAELCSSSSFWNMPKKNPKKMSTISGHHSFSAVIDTGLSVRRADGSVELHVWQI